MQDHIANKWWDLDWGELNADTCLLSHCIFAFQSVVFGMVVEAFHPLGAHEKCRLSDLTPDLRNQNLHSSVIPGDWYSPCGLIRTILCYMFAHMSCSVSERKCFECLGGLWWLSWKIIAMPRGWDFYLNTVENMMLLVLMTKGKRLPWQVPLWNPKRK